jgi:type III secretory pathway lipoprotein EscJ
LIKLLLRCILLCLCLGSFSACERVQVAEDLNQQEAHEVINVLSQAGIQSESERGRGGSSAKYSVGVGRSDYTAAIKLLAQNSLPRERGLSFSELIEPKGLIPNSREIEALRVDQAIARQLEELIANKAGVLSVKAAVRMHFSGGESAGPQVALVIRQTSKASVNSVMLVPIIQSMVPGIPVENIRIDLSEAESTQSDYARYGIKTSAGGIIAVPLVPFLFWNIPGDEHYAMAVTTLALLGAAILLGALFGYYYAFYVALKRSTSGEMRSTRIAGAVDNYSVKNLPDR